MNMDPGTWSIRVATTVRAEMVAQGRTTSDLAELLQIAVNSASRRLNGTTAFDLVEIEQIAAWLGTSPSALVLRTDGPGGGEQAEGSAS